MIRKLTSLVAATAFSMVALAPATPAAAHDRRYGGYERHDRDYYDGRRGGYGDRCRGYRHRDRDNDNDEAIAAGVIGLVLGLAIGAAAEQEQRRDYYDRSYSDRRYDDDRYYDGYSDDRPQCTRRERQWDRYARRYVYVDVPC